MLGWMMLRVHTTVNIHIPLVPSVIIQSISKLIKLTTITEYTVFLLRNKILFLNYSVFLMSFLLLSLPKKEIISEEVVRYIRHLAQIQHDSKSGTSHHDF